MGQRIPADHESFHSGRLGKLRGGGRGGDRLYWLGQKEKQTGSAASSPRAEDTVKQLVFWGGGGSGCKGGSKASTETPGRSARKTLVRMASNPRHRKKSCRYRILSERPREHVHGGTGLTFLAEGQSPGKINRKPT